MGFARRIKGREGQEIVYFQGRDHNDKLLHTISIGVGGKDGQKMEGSMNWSIDEVQELSPWGT